MTDLLGGALCLIAMMISPFSDGCDCAVCHTIFFAFLSTELVAHAMVSLSTSFCFSLGIYATVVLFFRTMTNPAAIENRASSSVSSQSVSQSFVLVHRLVLESVVKSRSLVNDSRLRLPLAGSLLPSRTSPVHVAAAILSHPFVHFLLVLLVQNRTYAQRHGGRSYRPPSSNSRAATTSGGNRVGGNANIRGVRDLGTASCAVGG